MPMRRRVSASLGVTIATIGVALLVPHAPGAQAAVMCEGQVATIVGTNGNDTLQGTDGVDVIVGLDGDDTITAAGGDDVVCPGRGGGTIDGGSGVDTISYRDVADDTKLILGSGRGEIGRSPNPRSFVQIPGFENAVGGSGDIHDLRGDSADNVLTSVGGCTTFSPGAGNDRVIGRTCDRIDYHLKTFAPGVRVNIGAGTATGWGNDTFTGVGGAIGTPFADVLIGDSRNNGLSGEGGDDVIEGWGGNDVLVVFPTLGGSKATGGAGDDEIDLLQLGSPVGVESVTANGGPGNDTIRVFNFAALTMSLSAGTATSAQLAAKIPGFENAWGGDGDDVITGTSGPNVLRGGDGTDQLQGWGGDDRLFGDYGNDLLDGGSGADLCKGPEETTPDQWPGQIDRATKCETVILAIPQ